MIKTLVQAKTYVSKQQINNKTKLRTKFNETTATKYTYRAQTNQPTNQQDWFPKVHCHWRRYRNQDSVRIPKQISQNHSQHDVHFGRILKIPKTVLVCSKFMQTHIKTSKHQTDTDTHTHKHTYTQAHIHTHKHRHSLTQTHTPHTQTHTHKHTDTCTDTDTHTHAHKHKHLHTHTHTHTHTHSHTHTLAHTLTHIYQVWHLPTTPAAALTVSPSGHDHHFSHRHADHPCDERDALPLLQHEHLSHEHLSANTCHMNTLVQTPVTQTPECKHLSHEHLSANTCHMNTWVQTPVTWTP